MTNTNERLAPIHVPIPEACAALGIGRTKLFELIASGALETVAIGRRRLVPVASLTAFAESLRSHPTPAA